MSVPAQESSKNPLRNLWNGIGTFGGIISFSSLVENWFKEIVKWHGFILEIIEAYRTITAPIWKIIFGWLPWDILWVGDYLLLGIIIYASFLRGIRFTEELKSGAKLNLGMLGISIPVILLLWPGYLVFLAGSSIYYNHASTKQESKRILLWFASVLLGFVLLLAINSQLVPAGHLR
ncbi:MAG: hypothetical protein JJ977_18705 [Kordiimonadaceae bacterium]|nr:hypothetical protein [Kordiimonadaceae bacterium]